jgi:hypothetical protein
VNTTANVTSRPRARKPSAEFDMSAGLSTKG